MPYNKTNWQNEPSTATPITAENLNKLETQYDSVMAEVGAPGGLAGLDADSRLLDTQVPTRLGTDTLDQRYKDSWNVRSQAQILDAIAEIETVGSGVIRVPAGVTISLDATISLPNSVRELVIDGSVAVSQNVVAFQRDGVPVGSNISITSPITAGQRTVTADGSSLSVGDWVFVVSTDTIPSRGAIPSTGDKLGYMRQIRSIGSGSVTFDSPIPRDMPSTSRRMRKISLATPLVVSGSGDIYQTNPAVFTQPLFKLFFSRDVTFSSDLRLHDGGGTAIYLGHVVGFQIDCVIDNFVDDLATGHVGYGVNVSGGSRDGRVSGIISRCRHAFTTNVGPNHPQFVFYGEPENILVNPVTRYCTDKALDTHRAGLGIKLICRDMGSGGQVQVRADDCYVEIHASGVFNGDCLTVWNYVTIPPTVGPVVVRDCNTNVVKADSDVIFTAFPRKISGPGPLFSVASDAVITLPPERRTCTVSQEQTVVNSTVSVDVTGLSFIVEPNSVYNIDGFISMYANQTGDARFSWSFPDGSNMQWTVNALSTGTTSASGSIIRNVSSSGSNEIQVGGVGSNLNSAVLPKGYLTTGATGGTVQFRFAQGVADPTGVSIRQGSYITVDRVR